MMDEIKTIETSNCLECKLQSVLLCHCVKDENNPAKKELSEGKDYYIDELGRWIFTEHYHLKRGSCCHNGCKHCPYGHHELKQWL